MALRECHRISTTLFGREYLAISDGKTGNDLPRQFDDTNSIASARAGAGARATVLDENVIVAFPRARMARRSLLPSPLPPAQRRHGKGFSSVSRRSSPHGLAAGQSVTITGVGVAGYNARFPSSRPPSTTQFSYIAGASGLAASGGGTVASATVTIQTAVALDSSPANS